MPDAPFTPDVRAAIQAVEDTAQKVLAWRDDRSAFEIQSPAEFKTEADRRAHLALSAALRAAYSDTRIISEEDAEHDSQRPSTYWLIDPIDGTASWYHGFSGFVSQAALIRNEQVECGIICAPALQKTWVGVRGQGAWLNGVRLPRLTPTARLVLVDNYPEPRGAAKKVMEQLPATGYLESGSLGLKAALVADGTADIFLKDVVVRDWDLAPAMALLEAVGAHICLPSGEPYRLSGPYAKPSGVVVARDPELTTRVISLLS